jgi:hypothetical protein
MQTLQNGIEVPTNSDNYALTEHLANMGNKTNVIVKVTDLAARDALDKYDGLTVRRLDIDSRPTETWNGVTWVGGDTGWLDVPLLNDFTGFASSGWSGLKYRIRNGWVIVNGAVQRGTSWPNNQVCGYMPAGVRPIYRVQGANIQVDETQGYLIMSGGGPGAYSFSATYPVA